MELPKSSQQTKNIPTVFIIFGATGDLMGKKIIPALFQLYVKGKLPKLFKVIGFSRRDWGDTEFAQFVKEIVEKYKNEKLKSELVDAFLKLFMYQRGDFDTSQAYKVVAEKLGIIDNGWNVCSNKLFYLAVPPQFYKSIFEHLAASGLTIPCGPEEGWTRVIVEKPFGSDLKTAEELDSLLGKLFKEEQLYRIDHYLAKEMLQNILSFRFANTLFEHDWNNTSIEKIEIRLLEKEGVETRGAFYDSVGALRDVGQNHLLQMLALITMEQPLYLNAFSVRQKRAEILSSLQQFSLDDVERKTFRAQYNGYHSIKGVKPQSWTETYFKLIATLSHPRWVGVPIILEGGKKIIDNKEIVVTFRHEAPCLCPAGGKHYQNKVIFRIAPKEEIDIEFWVKKPGLEYEMQKQTLSYLYRDQRKKVQYIEEYEKLLLDCIAGNQLLFVDTKEVRAMWKFIDPIIRGWEKNCVPLYIYEQNKKKILLDADKNLLVKNQTENEYESYKTVGVIGLGKMGGNIARRLVEKGWNVIAYNRSTDAVNQFVRDGGNGAYSIEELASKLKNPRTIILSLPAGETTDNMIDQLIPILSKGDLIIDGANAYYKESAKNSEKVARAGLYYLDAGISGGPGGARRGACIMVGGKREIFDRVRPIFEDMAAENGVAFFDGAGAGHFVKMVHNGIEYGMMQSLAEGFEVLKKSPYNLDLKEVARIYNTKSVIESRLTKWLCEAFEKFGTELKGISSAVASTGEAESTIKTAKELGVEVSVIEKSLQFRINSVKKPSYGGKILTALRNMFGGHSIS